jgi:hypothetical protein
VTHRASWIAVYRRLLALLPASLRDKHGDAMVALYARDLERAQSRGAWHVATAGLAGVRDLITRSAIEQCRPRESTDGAATARLRSLGVAFGASTLALTLAFVALAGRRFVPRLAERGESVVTIAEALLLAVPFTMALTLPMAVLLTVLLASSDRGSARDTAPMALAHRRRRLGLVPVLAAASVIAALTLVVNTQVVPRANDRLATVLAGHAVAASERSMTVSALRDAARDARIANGPDARTRIASYEVEIHKKFALAAACVVLAVVGLAIARATAARAPHGRTGLVVTASCGVYVAYYLLLTTGETLADARVVSPAIGMWGANALLLVAALLAGWHGSGRRDVLIAARRRGVRAS